MPTGSGKTATFSAITELATARDTRVWIIVPRNELLQQSSDSLTRVGVAHGRISAGTNESRAYLVHIVSKDTLTRRWDRIKNWPNLVIIDECHLNLDFQISLREHLPDTTKLVGVTATPERLDGRGLSTQAGGVYDVLVKGPDIPELVQRGYLTGVRYFCPPIDGLADIHRKGTEFDGDELDALLSRRAVYGKAIDHYREHANGKACLVYCRSVKVAYDMAERFRQAGYRFECIEGNMGYEKRRALIEGLSDGRLHGLTSCEIVTYGVDIPRVECLIMLRPTLSRVLFSQMVGRGLRPYTSDGVKKQTCIILDHVNNLMSHGHPLGDYIWSFDGREKQSAKKGDSEAVLKMCPECFLYYEGSVCPNCGHYGHREKKYDEQVIDGRLVEVGALPLKERPQEERRSYEQRIEDCVAQYRIDGGAVKELLKLAGELGYSPLWVYHRLSEGMRAVNVPLVHEIGRIKGFKSGWAYFTIKNLRGARSAI
jgi:superfamily II DNA or RNA helicase